MFLSARGELIADASVVGPLAAGVPGTVAGLALAEQKHGKLGLARVLEPAIRLAEQGFPVSYALSQSLREERELLSKFPETSRVFLRDGRFYEPGEIFKQPELGQTLRDIGREGPQAFYRGRVAEAIVATMEKYHGLISRLDLEQYQPKARRHLEGHFRGFKILTVTPPSSGGVVRIEMHIVLDASDQC